MKMRVIFPVNTTLEIAIIKPEKNSGLYEIWTHDFCDIPTELTNPLGALSVCNKPVLWWMTETWSNLYLTFINFL